jgi:hypothetical protein
MDHEQSRTDANSRERSPDHQYSLSIEQTAEIYAAAGLSRSIRAIQKYCALTKLDCHKVETETGEKYLVAPYSVERHIAYINEVRTDATSREQTRTFALWKTRTNSRELSPRTATNSRERTRPFAPLKLQSTQRLSVKTNHYAMSAIFYDPKCWSRTTRSKTSPSAPARPII